MSRPALSVEGVSKRYGGVLALDDVSFDIEQGEVRALLGKNGAGKSTLVKVLCGAVQPDSGAVFLDGEPLRIASPLDAFRHGIVTVHQEPHIVPGLTVAENIMLGRWGRRGIIDRDAVLETSRAALARLRSKLDPRQPAARLSIANWQIIEIARALTQDVRVLVMDEPTSALSPSDAETLVATVRSLAAEGVTVIYVSHRLDEIPRVADRVTVLREGALVDTVDARRTSARTVIELMVGSAWVRSATEDSVSSPGRADREVALQTRGLSVPGRLDGVDLDLHRGEVLGLAGLVGAGRSELLRAIYGAIESTGTVSVDGRVLAHRSPARMRRHGVALVTDDRKREGLFFDLSVADNITLGNLGQVSRRGVISRRRRAAAAVNGIRSLGIKTSGVDQNVQGLSGGNQQKVVIARCLAAGVRVLLLDEPTRGVDVEAKFQIYDFLRSLGVEGLSVIVAPSEFDELGHMCDRVLTLRAGRVVGEARDGVDIAEIMATALGEKEPEAVA
jgi:ABC-type sugar transport system ATPase subunit